MATAVAKYWVCKRGPGHAAEALECLGGNGYVEESVLPRIYRQQPLQSIWEGSGNVICLDVLRALRRNPETSEAFVAECREAHGAERRLDAWLTELEPALRDPEESDARRLVERMGLALQASLLVRFGDPAVADAFCASRLAGDGRSRLRNAARARRCRVDRRAAPAARGLKRVTGVSSLRCGSVRQDERSRGVRALHEGEPFVIPNPWDAGSARVLDALGFRALATTSSGFAFTLGRLDGGATLDDVVAHVRALDEARTSPSSVDLENGYGADPEAAARAITRVAEAGAVGGSIEDYDPEDGRLYELQHATERIAAAAETAHGLGFPFMLTARAENHLRGNPDLDDTIARLQASNEPAPTSSTRRGCAASTRSAPSAPPSRSR